MSPDLSDLLYSFSQGQFLKDETQGRNLICGILINEKRCRSENFYIKASVKTMEGIVQNTPELGNPNQSENVYETTESKVCCSWRNRNRFF